MEKSTKEERLALTQMAHNKIQQKTRAATERVAMGLDGFTKKMLTENQYMNQEVFFNIHYELLEFIFVFFSIKSFICENKNLLNLKNMFVH